MKRYQLQEKVDKRKLSEYVEGLLYGCPKNKALDIYRDYYNGNQWRITNGRSNTTRSGKVMWEAKEQRTAKDTGFTTGELKTWNLCDIAVDVYTSYLLGDKREKSRLIIKGMKSLQDKVNDRLNIQKIIKKTAHRISVDSVCIWKITSDGGIEFIDAREIFPIYEGDEQVGTLRTYKVYAGDPVLEGMTLENSKSKDHFYTEVWMPENGKMKLYKYIDDDLIEEGDAPYEFNPYIAVINKDNEFENFDEDNTEISDVGKIIDIQDDLNSTITDISLINRKVAIPMFRVAQEAYNEVLKGNIDVEKFKQSLESLTIAANRIMAAPVEKVETDGLPASTMQFLDSIFTQFYMTTGIPRTIFVSEGIGNVSQKTAELLLESLKRRIDEKRMNIEQAFKEYISCITGGNKQAIDATSVDYPDIMGLDELSKVDVVTKSGELLPEEYKVEKILAVLGDLDRMEEITGSKMENSLSFRVAVEKQRLQKELEQEMTKAKEEAITAKSEKGLLEKEIESIISGI